MDQMFDGHSCRACKPPLTAPVEVVTVPVEELRREFEYRIRTAMALGRGRALYRPGSDSGPTVTAEVDGAVAHMRQVAR